MRTGEDGIPDELDDQQSKEFDLWVAQETEANRTGRRARLGSNTKLLGFGGARALKDKVRSAQMYGCFLGTVVCKVRTTDTSLPYLRGAPLAGGTARPGTGHWIPVVGRQCKTGERGDGRVASGGPCARTERDVPQSVHI